MSRNEDFNDMPDLGPARDDMDEQDIPTLEPMQQQSQTAPPRAASPGAGKTRSSRGVIYTFLISLLLIAGLGFWSYNAQVALQQQLAQAQASNARLQVRVTDIEQLVDAADESANKSGAALQAQLRKKIQDDRQRVEHVDSEIRKLWAIYQKYRPQIESIEKEVKTVAGSLDTLGLSMDKQSQALNQAQSSLTQFDQRLATLKSSMSEVDQQQQQRLESLSEELRTQYLRVQEQNDLHSAQLTEIKQRLDKDVVDPAKLTGMQQVLKDHASALESINAYRRQVNTELLNLRERLANVQRTMSTP